MNQKALKCNGIAWQTLKEQRLHPVHLREREFSSSKQVLEGKAKQFRLAGRGKRPNKARQVSEEEEEILWKSGKLIIRGNNPESLIQTM